MRELTQKIVEDYISYCSVQKKLDDKTVKAYRIDLRQFSEFMADTDGGLTRENLSDFIVHLNRSFSPKSVKRKVASVKAFFRYLEYQDLLPDNPFFKMRVKLREPVLLPRIIPMSSIENLLRTAYDHRGAKNLTELQRQEAIRDVAVLETLFATGVRVSELCSLGSLDVDLEEGSLWIYGKGARERVVSIENHDVISALQAYVNTFSAWIRQTGYFFLNRCHHQLSDQSVRLIIRRYAAMANIKQHITPHMFRHSFATYLLEEDADIRYIQQILGHSSINTTQLYTYVAMRKQRALLTAKHPRNKIMV